jgi:hypothetical protein
MFPPLTPLIAAEMAFASWHAFLAAHSYYSNASTAASWAKWVYFFGHVPDPTQARIDRLENEIFMMRHADAESIIVTEDDEDIVILETKKDNQR